MGQYHSIYNIDKKEYITGHGLGCGAKLLEWGCSSIGPTTALAVLLCNSNGRGGGDLNNPSHEDLDKPGTYTAWSNEKQKHLKVSKLEHKRIQKKIDAVAGRWAGDRIVVQGDYAEVGDPAFITEADGNKFKCIDDQCREALSVDAYCKEKLDNE